MYNFLHLSSSTSDSDEQPFSVLTLSTLPNFGHSESTLTNFCSRLTTLHLNSSILCTQLQSLTVISSICFLICSISLRNCSNSGTTIAYFTSVSQNLQLNLVLATTSSSN